MEKTWMPTVAGILDIISGAFGLGMGLLLTCGRIFYGAAPKIPRFGMFSAMPEGFFLVLGVALILIGILAVIGGVYALKIKNWGMALTGSICATLCGRLLGVAALIFTVLSRKEFK